MPYPPAFFFKEDFGGDLLNRGAYGEEQVAGLLRGNLQEHPSRLQPRFDVAAVVVGEEGLAIEYLKDAFDGGGYELF